MQEYDIYVNLGSQEHTGTGVYIDICKHGHKNGCKGIIYMVMIKTMR